VSLGSFVRGDGRESGLKGGGIVAYTRRFIKMLKHECTGWALDCEVADTKGITGGKPTYED
jgi:hypothetical protein